MAHLPGANHLYYLRELLYGRGQWPVFYLGSWWWLKSYSWHDGTRDRVPGPFVYEVVMMNWAGHEKKFHFNHDVECVPYSGLRDDGTGFVEGVRIVPPCNNVNSPSPFWMVLVCRSPGTLPELWDRPKAEHKSEQSAIEAAEAAASSNDPTWVFYVMECVARTRVNRATTERVWRAAR